MLKSMLFKLLLFWKLVPWFMWFWKLLNQLDGFSSSEDVKVIAATNRVDVLDPALMRSGRLDRKIELPHPNEKARANIMEIHSRKMNYDKQCKLKN